MEKVATLIVSSIAASAIGYVVINEKKKDSEIPHFVETLNTDTGSNNIKLEQDTYENTLEKNISSDNILEITDSEDTKFLDGFRTTIQKSEEKIKVRKDVIPNNIEVTSVGKLETTDFALYFEHKGEKISIWHDVPLANKDHTFNFICEIPKWTRNKMEIDKKLRHNPIKQDLNKDGSLRKYNYGDMMFNYGAFPRTWEDPKFVSKYTNSKGDNDPLDVIEIGSMQLGMASVTSVKILGILAMIDNDETDWKVIVINKDDCMANSLNNINDVKEKIPGLLESLREWLTKYKTIDGKPENKFAFDGEYKDKEFAIKIIKECYDSWKYKFFN